MDHRPSAAQSSASDGLTRATFIYLDVKDEKGNSTEWEIELMSLNHLRSYGWVRTTVKPVRSSRAGGPRAARVDDQRVVKLDGRGCGRETLGLVTLLAGSGSLQLACTATCR
jgi:hypothetical protein